MAANTVLMDFSIDPTRINDEVSRKDILKTIKETLEKFFDQLTISFDSHIADSFLCLLVDKTGLVVNVRFYITKGLITINIDYYKDDSSEPKITFQQTRELESILVKKLEFLHGQTLPALKRGPIVKYFPTADERIIEYDIDKVLFDKRSEFQKIQIVHSKTLGNMLILDELQNIAEADLIYTETLMQRGKENYKDKEICILGGGDGALLYELLKENPKNVVMLEIDDLVMEACQKYMDSICGDVLERRKGDNFEIIVGDCMVYLKKYIKEGKKFDYVFGDLTDIPISDDPNSGEIWDFIRLILESSFKVLKPTGKFMTHGNGASCPESLQMYENVLNDLTPKVTFTKDTAFVPSFYEDWVFYQVAFDA